MELNNNKINLTRFLEKKKKKKNAIKMKPVGR